MGMNHHCSFRKNLFEGALLARKRLPHGSLRKIMRTREHVDGEIKLASLWLTPTLGISF